MAAATSRGLFAWGQRDVVRGRSRRCGCVVEFLRNVGSATKRRRWPLAGPLSEVTAEAALGCCCVVWPPVRNREGAASDIPRRPLQLRCRPVPVPRVATRMLETTNSSTGFVSVPRQLARSVNQQALGSLFRGPVSFWRWSAAYEPRIIPSECCGGAAGTIGCAGRSRRRWH